MKLTIFLLTILFSVAYQDSIPDTINKAIEELRDSIPEPISVESINPDLSDNEYVSGYFNVSNLNLEGLKAFHLNVSYYLNILPHHVALTVDSLILDLDDSFDVTFLNVSLLHLYGDGKTRVELTNFTAEADLSFTLIPAVNVTVKELQMHLDGAKFTIEGIFNDEDWSSRFSDLLTSNVANIFNEQEHGLSDLLMEVLNKIIADLISGDDSLSNRSNDYVEKEPEVVLQELTEKLLSPLTSALSKI